MSLSSAAERFEVPPGLTWVAAFVSLELLAVGTYFAFTPAEVRQVRYVLYPLVWMTVGVWAVARTDPVAAVRRHRWLAGSVAVLYFLAMAYVTGLVGIDALTHLLTSGGHSHGTPQGFVFRMASPGWGPRVGYVLTGVYVYVVPYRVIGYLALAYLLYTTLLDATTVAASGLLGLFSCVSCAFPLFSELFAGIGAATLTGTVSALSTDLSTAVFVVAVVLLSWRPGVS